MNASHYGEHVKVTSGIAALLGLWLMVSPWAQGYAASDAPAAWNNAIVGLLIAVFAETRFFRPHRAPGLSWASLLLGVWTIVSPWVYGYTGDNERFMSSLIVGIVVTVLAFWSARVTAAERQRGPAGIERSRG